MNFFKKIQKNKGVTIIEVLIACSIISISMFALMQTAQRGIELSNYALKKSQASFLLEEGAEAVKLIRDNDWTTISGLNLSPTKYHLFFNTSLSTWVLNENTTTLVGAIPSYPIEGFDRTVTIESVGRDGSDDIVTSGGTIDPRTKKINVEVTWMSSGQNNIKNLSFYIADIFN